MTSCPLSKLVKPEWNYKGTVLDDNRNVFKQLEGDDSYACMQKARILEVFTELNRCDYARKSLIKLIDAANTEDKK